MKTLFASILLSFSGGCFIISCASTSSHYSQMPKGKSEEFFSSETHKTVNVTTGRPIDVILHAKDDLSQKYWDTSFIRRVWFTVRFTNGDLAPRAYHEILPAGFNSAADVSVADSLRIKLIAKKSPSLGFIVGNLDQNYSFYKIGMAGYYDLVFHVSCYNQKYKLIYRGHSETLRFYFSNRNENASQPLELNVPIYLKE